MIINMTTFAGRQKHYIDQTLESLSKSDGRDLPLNLILGSGDTYHVEQFRDVANFVLWDEEAESLAQLGGQRLACTVNAIRAIEYGEDEYCLCCEDDIVFNPDWLSQLMRTIEVIERKDYVLNLAHRCREVPDRPYVEDTADYLCGAQGLFYPSKALRNAVAQYLRLNLAKSTNDHLVGRYAKQYAVLYNTWPQLVGHRGQVSSFRKPNPPRTPPPKLKRNQKDVKESPEPKTEAAPEPEAAPRREAEQRADRPAPAPVHVANPPISEQKGGGTTEPSAEQKRVAEPQPHRARPAAAKASGRVPREASSAQYTSEMFVMLVRASLGTGTPPEAARFEACNLGQLERLASHHGLGGILYRTLQSQVGGVPAKRLRAFKFHYISNAFRSHQARQCLEQVGAAFAAEELPVIAMKGAALLQTLYDDPGLRVIGDVDLLVDERDFERAGTLLERMGLHVGFSDHAEGRGPLCHIHRVYWRTGGRSIPVELHWRLFEPYLPYIFDLNVVGAHARRLPALPESVFVMAPEHELAHLCVHLDRHAIVYRSLLDRQDWREMLLLPQGLARLIWLYDIALYVQRRAATIDWDNFVDVARRWAIDGRVYAPLELSRRALGVGPPTEILEALRSRRPRFVERMAHRAVMASHRANEEPKDGPAATARSRRLAGLSSNALRIANAWVSLLPPNAYLRAKYGSHGVPLWSRARHFREVAPGLWGEVRDRWKAAAAARRLRQG